MSRLLDAWNRFFFEPGSGLALGLFRAVYGLVVFVSVLGVFPARETFYGEHAIVSTDTMTRFLSHHWPLLSFSFLPITDPGLGLFLLALLIAAACLSLGLFTRAASFAVFVGLYSVHNRNLFVLNAGDLLMRIDALLLLFADSGASFSLDRWRERRRNPASEPRPISPWPVRLLQIQLSYLYLTTSLLKLSGGPSWKDGTAIYYALRYLELQRFRLTYLFYYLWQIKLATWGTIVAELSMGTFVWFRRIRYPILLAALALHTGINLALQFPVFQYVMMTNLLLFLEPTDLKRWRARLDDKKKKGLSRIPSGRAPESFKRTA